MRVETLLVLLALLCSIIIISCSQEDSSAEIQTLVIHEPAQKDRQMPQPSAERPAEQEPSGHAQAKQLMEKKSYEMIGMGQEIVYGAHRIHILDSEGSSARMLIDGEESELTQGESLVHNSIRVRLSSIMRYERESTGLVKFIFKFGGKWKQLSFSEKDMKSYRDEDDKYTVTLDFVGRRGAEEAAIFRVNDQRTDAMGERDYFYFKDGSYIYVQDIMSGRPRLVETTYLGLEVEEVE